MAYSMAARVNLRGRRKVVSAVSRNSYESIFGGDEHDLISDVPSSVDPAGKDSDKALKGKFRPPSDAGTPKKQLVPWVDEGEKLPQKTFFGAFLELLLFTFGAGFFGITSLTSDAGAGITVAVIVAYALLSWYSSWMLLVAAFVERRKHIIELGPDHLKVDPSKLNDKCLEIYQQDKQLLASPYSYVFARNSPFLKFVFNLVMATLLFVCILAYLNVLSTYAKDYFNDPSTNHPHTIALMVIVGIILAISCFFILIADGENSADKAANGGKSLDNVVDGGESGGLDPKKKPWCPSGKNFEFGLQVFSFLCIFGVAVAVIISCIMYHGDIEIGIPANSSIHKHGTTYMVMLMFGAIVPTIATSFLNSMSALELSMAIDRQVTPLDSVDPVSAQLSPKKERPKQAGPSLEQKGNEDEALKAAERVDSSSPAPFKRPGLFSPLSVIASVSGYYGDNKAEYVQDFVLPLRSLSSTSHSRLFGAVAFSVGVLYTAVAIFGHSRFGDAVKNNLLNNFAMFDAEGKSSTLAIAARLLSGFAFIISCGLYVKSFAGCTYELLASLSCNKCSSKKAESDAELEQPLLEETDDTVPGPKGNAVKAKKVFIAVIGVLVAVLMLRALCSDERAFGMLLGIAGSGCASLVMFLFPLIAFWRCGISELGALKNGMEWKRVETVLVEAEKVEKTESIPFPGFGRWIWVHGFLSTLVGVAFVDLFVLGLGWVIMHPSLAAIEVAQTAAL